MTILEEVINKVLSEEEQKTKDNEMFFKGWKRIDEASLNRIMSHREHGFIIISSQRSSLETWDKNPSLSLTAEYKDWLIMKDVESSEESVNEFLKERNAKAEAELNREIKVSGYAYSPVNGGYHYKDAPDNSNDSYEISYIVYNHKRSGVEDYGDFEELFKLALKWCAMFKQESVYVQFPNEAPHYYNAQGEICDSHSSKNFKFNDDKQEYFTTTKRKSNNPQKFTADIQFESMYRRKVSERIERMKRTQSGEVIFDDLDLIKRRK